MFDARVAGSIQGHDIDQPYNAITLTTRCHRLFGDFGCYFEPVPDKKYTYAINTLYPQFLARPTFSITRELSLLPTKLSTPRRDCWLSIARSLTSYIYHQLINISIRYIAT
ncbi:hypothetical protein F5Y14DRAFT_314751 [Nemania sp. NC0429]|nr:hypothetical protein F5Y14DRAFT_314751 [Nemania sp. NC0429]